MAAEGLREVKKARTRRLIADAAAMLFAERGYEQVAVADVAREAEVSEQTVYNYFRTKEQLVTDRGDEVEEQLCDLVRSRPGDVTPAAAIRDFVLAAVDGIRTIPAARWRGELGYLATISPTVHRLALELADRQATALAGAIAETSDVSPQIAKLHGIALSGVFQIIISEAGARTQAGEAQSAIADVLHAVIVQVIDELNTWFVATTAAAANTSVRLGE